MKNRFILLRHFSLVFLVLSFSIRIVFTFWQLPEVNVWQLPKVIITGLLFDIGVLSFFWSIFSLYLVIFPKKWNGSLFEKILTYSTFAFISFIIVFTLFAEITFWDEFKARFNFIAVDYLIYTYEVVRNINESYPLIILIPGMLLLTGIWLYIFRKKGYFKIYFEAKTPLTYRLLVLAITLAITTLYVSFLKNADAEFSTNRYNNEISKSGIYSFFAAMRNNEMDFNLFYKTIPNPKAFEIIKTKLSDSLTTWSNDPLSIKRQINDPTKAQIKNVVVIMMESMSAEFMQAFGNTQQLTPTLDNLANNSIFFTNLYATGTRTVRGMEAINLAIPPTPGSSIIKRPDNANLFTTAQVFKKYGYQCNFFYGGDGYFDNMNAFFGGNGFDIYDRGRGSILSDKIKTNRYNIADTEVTFENAWGICDEDIYNKIIQVTNAKYGQNKPFFHFVMTTSNHKPYTYPTGKVPMPSGSGREGAVQYADYALGNFLKKAQKTPWFKNTVFLIVADHCASSAGKDEIDVAHYHIPALLYNLSPKPQKINKLCSQIDLMPTLFQNLNFSYTSTFFGENICSKNFEERCFLGTYLKLGMLKQSTIVILSNQQKYQQYHWDKSTNLLHKTNIQPQLLSETIAWYQVADYMYKNKKIKSH